MKPLFDKCGGYRKLTSFTFAMLIHLGTMRFCKRFVLYKEDLRDQAIGPLKGRIELPAYGIEVLSRADAASC